MLMGGAGTGARESCQITVADYSKNECSIFFACVPDAAALARVEALAKKLRSEFRLKTDPTGASRYYVALHHLGSYRSLPQEIIARAREAASAIALPAFDLSFDRIMTLAGGRRTRPLVICGEPASTAGVMALQRALGTELGAAGLPRDASSYYTPHLTLHYADHLVAQRPVDPIGWHSSEFVLLQRVSGLSQHVVLQRWPLGVPHPAH